MANKKKEGPDQGMSWVVCLAAFTIVLIMNGLGRVSALIFVELVQVYGVTREQASLPFVVREGIRDLIGPFVGMLGHRFQIRKVTVFGGMLSAVGVGLCFFASDVNWIIAFWGVVFGFGFGMANTLHYVAINHYFVRYRAIAAGIVASGSCFGSFILPPIGEIVIEDYGLKGTFVIIAGIILNSVPAGLLLRTPSWIQQDDNHEKVQPEVNNETTHLKGLLPSDTTNYGVQNEGIDNIVYPDNIKTVNGSIALMQPSSKHEGNGQAINEVSQEYTKVIRFGIESPSDSNINGIVEQKNLEESSRDVQEKSLFMSAIGHVVKFLSSLRVMSDVMFLHIALSLAVSTFVVIPVITIISDLTIDKGIEETMSKYVIWSFSVGDLVGRIGLGWIIDKGYLTLKVFTILSNAMMGAFLLLVPFVSSLEAYMTLLACFGLVEGAVILTFPLQVGLYLDSKQQAQAFGSATFFSGVLSFAIPATLGHFRDRVGSYDGLFYLTGAMSILCGLSWLLEPLLLKFRLWQNRTKTECESSRL